MVNLQTRKVGKYVMVDVVGRLERLKDSLALKSLLNTLAEESPLHLALNLAGINYLDSGGLSVFVYAEKKITAAGGSFSLVAPNEYVREIIDTVGLDQKFPLYPAESDLPA
jgi:anti-sigma B factor antagonist